VFEHGRAVMGQMLVELDCVPGASKHLGETLLAVDQFQIPQIVVLQFDQVERDQRDVMIAATAAGAPGVSRSSNRVAMPFAAVHESEDRTFRT